MLHHSIEPFRTKFVYQASSSSRSWLVKLWAVLGTSIDTPCLLICRVCWGWLIQKLQMDRSLVLRWAKVNPNLIWIFQNRLIINYAETCGNIFFPITFNLVFFKVIKEKLYSIYKSISSYNHFIKSNLSRWVPLDDWTVSCSTVCLN